MTYSIQYVTKMVKNSDNWSQDFLRHYQDVWIKK